MKAAVFQGPERVAVETVPDPAIEEPGDVVVGVVAAGICGSDLHPYFGRERGLDPGTVMGHEVAGVVLETGPAVRGFRPGDRVVSPFTTACGACFFCRRGLTSRCERGELLGWRHEGVGLQGAQAERVRIPLGDSTLVRLPGSVAMVPALLAGDVLATGWYAAERTDASPGSVVLVLGCGAVGLCSILALRALGTERILGVDALPDRLATAARFGAEPVALGPEVVARVRDITEGRGVDAVVEAVGSPAAARLAWEAVRPGGTLSTVGVHTEESLAFSPMEAYDKNLTYRVGRCPARAYLERLLPHLPDLASRLEEIVTQRLPLTAAADAYRRFGGREPGWTKVVLEPGATEDPR